LYKDISLLTHKNDAIKFENALNWLFVPHARHVHSLQIWGCAISSQDSRAWEQILVKFLQQCINITTLDLWFRPSLPEHQWSNLRDVALSLITQRKLTYLGFYGRGPIFGIKGSGCKYNVHLILQAIAESESARTRLKGLYLDVFTTLPETQALVLSRYPNLYSLIFNGGFHIRPNLCKVDLWKCLDSLTRLKIYNCGGIIASDIPGLVALFPALRELLVSDLDHAEGFHTQYPMGWHLLPNALCNTHQPLECIHIDKLICGEIRSIGVIPTKMLITTGMLPTTILSDLRVDVNLFPGLKILQREDKSLWTVKSSNGVSGKVALEEWCAARNIEIRTVASN
jgi:hypothetical protein